MIAERANQSGVRLLDVRIRNLIREKIGRRAPASLREEEGYEARVRRPQPHDLASETNEVWLLLEI
jgi:hypothetical protein